MWKICMNCGEIIHEDYTKCQYCSSDNISELNSTATLGDYFIICKISEDPVFIKTMMELHDTDIVEYTLKLNQFKQQVQAQENNIPRCPHCKSTNIKKISGLNRGASIAMWGVFSKKINKSFECKKCGFTW